MPKVLSVAWREFKHTALTKAFIIGAVVVPMVMVVLAIVVPILLAPRPGPLEGRLVIIDPTGLIGPAATDEFSPQKLERYTRNPLTGSGTRAPGPDEIGRIMEEAADNPAAAGPIASLIEIRVEIESDPLRLDELRMAIATDDDLLGVAVIDPAMLSPGAIRGPSLTLEREQGADGAATNDEIPSRYELFVPDRMNQNHVRVLERGISEAIVRTRVAEQGLHLESLRAMTRQPSAGTRRVTPDGEDREDHAVFAMMLPFAFMFLLWITTFSIGNHLLTTTIEEKSNKVMEVLLSAVSPLQLMSGKILGLALVSLVILFMYGGVAIAGLIAFSMAGMVQISHLVYLFFYFIMAYFMIAAIMAGIGSAVSDLHEAQSLVTPAMLVLIIPLFLWMPISQTPNGTLAIVTSFIPPLTPFIMILRITSTEGVVLWQIILSIVWGLVCAAGMVWLCGRIFRVGVLMYGKPPTPLELLKWLRYS